MSGQIFSIAARAFASIEIPTKSEQLSIIQIDFWTILISLLNLLIIFLIVRKFLFKPVKKVFAQRKEEVDRIYKEANDAKDAADADKEYYLARKEAAEEEAEDIVRRATEEAKKAGDGIVKEAKAEAEAVKQKAERDIAQEKLKAINEAKAEIAEISMTISEKIVGREITDEDQKEYVKQLVNELNDDGQ